MTPFLRYVDLKRDTVPDWDRYPFSIPAIRSLDRLNLEQSVTIFVGENGAGKSTLIEALALRIGHTGGGGTRAFSAVSRSSESELHDHLQLARSHRRERAGFFLRAETMYDIATRSEDLGDYGWEPLHEKSHGEAFLWVMQHRFRDSGLYILDEPESALSPTRQLACLARMRQLVLAGSQFIVATHSPILMAYPHARIYQLGADGIRPVKYTETEHYAVTRDFLLDPKRATRRLFEALDAEVEGEDDDVPT